MRVFTLSLFSALGVFAGCLDSAAPDNGAAPPGVGGNADTSTDLSTGAPPDLGADPADLAPPRKLVDLASTDLAGYVNCFGAAVCDPTMAFCIKFHTGSQAAPGNVASGSPACYVPNDCNGTNMNCDCITQDAALGASCQSCVDHQDGTYDCYAMQ